MLKKLIFTCMFISTIAHATDSSASKPRYSLDGFTYGRTDASGTLQAAYVKDTNKFSARFIKPDGSTHDVENPRQNYFKIKAFYEQELIQQICRLQSKLDWSFQTQNRVGRKEDDFIVEYAVRNSLTLVKATQDKSIESYKAVAGMGIDGSEFHSVYTDQDAHEHFTRLEARYAQEAHEDREADQQWNKQLKKAAESKSDKS